MDRSFGGEPTLVSFWSFHPIRRGRDDREWNKASKPSVIRECYYGQVPTAELLYLD